MTENLKVRKTANLMNWQIEKLRMLTDTQIIQKGYDPQTVTKICMELDAIKKK